MKYIISDLVNDYIKEHAAKHNISYRRYAIDRDVNDNELTQIRMGHKIPSGKKVAKLVDLRSIREPLTEEMSALLNTLDTEILIDAYNIMYSKETKRLKTEVLANETTQDL